MKPPRFEVVKHTDHRSHAYQVRDLLTDERHGFALMLLDAIELADAHDTHYHQTRNAAADALMASRPYEDA